MRTDIHSPKQMVPSNYRILANSYGLGEGEIEWEGTDEWKTLGCPTKGELSHSRIGKCDHCGASHIYQTIILCVTTNEILSVGHICASERFGRSDWKNVIADGKRRAELKAKRVKNVNNAIASMNEEELAAYHWGNNKECPNRIAMNIASNVENYGPLSFKQKEFLVRLHQRQIENDKKLAEGVLVPCPEGKIIITGTVISTKSVDTPYGWSFKMLIEDITGFKVFGTVPSASDIQPGDKVVLTATVSPSDKDKSFGFYSRPKLIAQSREVEGMRNDNPT